MMAEKNSNETEMEFAGARFVLRSSFKGRKIMRGQANVKVKSKLG